MKWKSYLHTTLFVLIAIVTLIVVTAFQEHGNSYAHGGTTPGRSHTFADEEVLSISNRNFHRSYWELSPSTPPYWPVVSVLMAIIGMWMTRNIVDRYRYWIRAAILGFLFAPLPIPGGAHIPAIGIVPAAEFLLAGMATFCRFGWSCSEHSGNHRDHCVDSPGERRA